MRRAIPVLAVLVLLGAGCSDDETSSRRDADASPETTDAAFVYEPVFEPGPCDAARVPEDRATVECGTLVVPEDRGDPQGAVVRLPVAIVRSASPTPAADPIVYFSGGPGNAGLEASNRFAEIGIAPDRDMIYFDQRGTGAAVPSLECPEFEEATYRLFETTDPPETEATRQAAALEDCRDRLRADGIDLAHYDTPTTAADVADLRRALDIDEWNLFGISYGTAVALEVLRSHPEGVRSVVIDSVVPPDRPMTFTDDFREARRVYRTLFEGCAASPECAAAYPDLEGELDAAVAALDAAPYATTVTSTSRPVEARFTGGDLVAGIWNAMYDIDLIPLVPFFVRQLNLGNVEVLTPVADDGLASITDAAEAQTVSVECADRQELVDVETVREVALAEPRFATLASVQPIPLLCEGWDVPSSGDGWGEIPESPVPVLVLGNEYDPVTPPEDSQRTAEALGKLATYVFFPGLGHGATRAHECPASIFRAFMAAPDAEVDTACLASMGPPAWVTAGP